MLAYITWPHPFKQVKGICQCYSLCFQSFCAQLCHVKLVFLWPQLQTDKFILYVYPLHLYASLISHRFTGNKGREASEATCCNTVTCLPVFWPWVTALLFTPLVETLFVLMVSATAGLAYRLPLFNHTSSHWSGTGKGIVCGIIKIRGSRQAILKAQQSPFVLVQRYVQVTLPTFSNNRMCKKSIVDLFIPCQTVQFWKSVICIVKKTPTPDWTHYTPLQGIYSTFCYTGV